MVPLSLPNDYAFFCPVKLCSGRRALEHLPCELRLLGVKRPLVLTNHEMVGAKQLKTIIHAFNDSDVSLSIFDQVPPAPAISIVRRIVQLYREHTCDGIIAAGYGSICDIAKVVSLALAENSDDLNQFTEENTITGPIIPYITILTSSGNGCEMTKFAQIGDMQFSSHFLMPRLVVLDPRLTTSEHVYAWTSTALIALVHAVEVYTYAAPNPLAHMYARTAIQLIQNHLANVITDSEDKQGRVALLNAAVMAGCALSASTPGPIHALGQEISAVCALPPGLCMGIVLPYVLEYTAQKEEYGLPDILLPLTSPDNYANISEDERSQKIIERVRTFLKEIYVASGGGIPLTLQAANVSRNRLKDIAQAVVEGGFKKFEASEYLEILEHAWEGKAIRVS
jgi:alcohol dehydrogenase